MSTIAKKPSVAIPPELLRAADIRGCKLGYETRSAYIVALIRADIANNYPHGLPMKIASQPRFRRDGIDEELIGIAQAMPDAGLVKLVDCGAAR